MTKYSSYYKNFKLRVASFNDDIKLMTRPEADEVITLLFIETILLMKLSLTITLCIVRDTLSFSRGEKRYHII